MTGLLNRLRRNLNVTYFLCGRFLFARGKRRLRPDTVFLVLGIMLSVATLMVGFSLFNGYEKALREVILGANSHIYIFNNGIADLNEDDLEILRSRLSKDSRIAAMSPMVSTPAMVLHKANSSGILLRGLDPTHGSQTTDFNKYVRRGDPSLKDPSLAIVGSRLAHELGVQVGDTIQIFSPLRMKFSLMGLSPTKRYLRVSGLYESGMYQYDSQFLFANIDVARDFMPNRGEYSWIEIKLREPWIDRADEVASVWNSGYGGPYRFISWKYHHANLFELLTLEKWVIFIIFSFLVEIATFNVISAVSTTILEKSREIGILRAMGTPLVALKAVFLSQVVAIAAIAVLLGEILGYIVANIISVQTLYKLKGEVYFMEDLHVSFGWESWLLIFGIGCLLVFLAGLIPLHRIGKMNINAIVRGE